MPKLKGSTGWATAPERLAWTASMSGSGHLATLATDLARQGDRPGLRRFSEERRRARAGVAHGAVPTRPPSVPGTSRSGASTPSPLSAPWPTPPPTGGAKALPSVPQLKRRDVAVGPVTRNTRRTKRVELPTLWRGPGPGAFPQPLGRTCERPPTSTLGYPYLPSIGPSLPSRTAVCCSSQHGHCA